MKQDIPWNRLAIESIVIAGSILLAFAVDAWWAERLERSSEREELFNLLNEFNLNVERLDRQLSENSIIIRIRDTALEIHNMLMASNDIGSATTLIPDSKISNALGTPTFEVYKPVYDSLVQSGRMEIIGSRQIVQAFSEWDRAVINLNEWQ